MDFSLDTDQNEKYKPNSSEINLTDGEDPASWNTV